MEQTEKSNNSQLAREIELALPVELSREEQTRLVREYCSSQFVSKGMCADFNIHDTGSGNPHAHILLTISEWKQEYADLKAQRDTDYTKLKAARAEVAELQKIRKCVDIALKAEQPEQTQNRTKRQEQER